MADDGDPACVWFLMIDVFQDSVGGRPASVVVDDPENPCPQLIAIVTRHTPPMSPPAGSLGGGPPLARL